MTTRTVHWSTAVCMCCSWQWVLTLSVSVPAFTEHETEVIADFILAGFAEFSGEVTALVVAV